MKAAYRITNINIYIYNDGYSEIGWLSYHKPNILTSGFHNATRWNFNPG